MKIREDYIKAAVGKSHIYKKRDFSEEDRLFPFTDNTAYMLWHNALEKAKMSERDKSTGLYGS